MSDIGSSAWAENAAGNNSGTPNGWPEGQSPSSVNDCAREMMAAVKRLYDQFFPTLTTGGTSTAYTLTSATQGETAYYAGQLYSFVINATCGTSPSLNINGLGAIALRKFSGGSLVALSAGDIQANQVVTVRYNSSAPGFFDLVSPIDSSATTSQPVSPWSTGDAKLTLKAVADTGWIMMNDGTIGSASSGATTRANADTQSLYTLLWNNVSNTYAPVTGGRGANAAADFAANKPLQLTLQLGRALAISGAGSGLTSRSLGQTVGEETHALTAAENGPHAHTSDNALPWAKANNDAFFVSPGTVGGAFIGFDSGTTASSGSGTAHNNMQPTAFWNVMIKL